RVSPESPRSSPAPPDSSEPPQPVRARRAAVAAAAERRARVLDMDAPFDGSTYIGRADACPQASRWAGADAPAASPGLGVRGGPPRRHRSGVAPYRALNRLTR